MIRTRFFRGITCLFCFAAAVAQAATARPFFEVVSMKLAAPRDTIGSTDDGGPGTATPRSWRCTNISLGALLMKAWGVHPAQISAPRDVDVLRYDIAAKAPEGVTLTDFRQMIQQMLVDRVHLQAHTAVREMDVQEMVIARGGPKLKSAEPARPGVPTARRVTFSEGAPQLAPGIPMAFHAAPAGKVVYVGRVQSIDDLIRTLEGPVGQIITDKTGLTGVFDYVLTFPRPDAADAPPGAAGVLMRASLASALIEQLGLKLQPAKARVEVLIVEHVDKTPPEN